MGTDIHGGGEINARDYSSESVWLKVLDIRALCGRNYTLFARLFGVRNSGQREALASRRGLPPDASSEIRDALGGNGWVGRSWISFRELKPHLGQMPVTGDDWGWSFVLDSMIRLAEHYGDDNVRMVVAFDNDG